MSKQESYEAGKEIVSFCGKCKVETDHIILAMLDDEPKRVMCKECDSQHNYRKLKAVKVKKTTVRKGPSTKARANALEAWNTIMAKAGSSKVVPYNMAGNYEKDTIIEHAAFGMGGVTEKNDANRIEVLFESGVKSLAINRR